MSSNDNGEMVLKYLEASKHVKLFQQIHIIHFDETLKYD